MEERQWFLYVADRHEGPYTIPEIRQKLKEGQAKTSSFVWKDGFADWVMMSDVNDFSDSAALKSDGHGPHTFAIGNVSASAAVWCLSANKVFTGPYSMKVLIKKLNEREIKPTDTVWKEGWTEFVPITKIPEFMRQVKPDALKLEIPNDKKKPTSSAAALGLGGKPSTMKKRGSFFGTLFKIILFLGALAGLYHATQIGLLDPVLEKAGIKEKVKAMNLPPLSSFSPATVGAGVPALGNLGADLAKNLGAVSGMLAPLVEYYHRGVALLPPQIGQFLSAVNLPEGLAPRDAENLKSAATARPEQGARAASAVLAGDELKPSFVVAGNMPDGSTLTATLEGKAGTLIGAQSYEKTFEITLNKHVARTAPFTFEGAKALPKGEYQLKLAQGGKTLTTDPYFLGGRKDAAYAAKLKEHEDALKATQGKEIEELRQTALTIESLANESAMQFFKLSKTAMNPAKRKVWLDFHAKYVKMSGQLTSVTLKARGDKAALALPDLYERLFQTSEIADRLHTAQNSYMATANPKSQKSMMAEIQQLASKTAGSINELKQSISKVSK